MKEQKYGENIARGVMFANNIGEYLKKMDAIIGKLDLDIIAIFPHIYETFLLYARKGYLTDKSKFNIYFFYGKVINMITKNSIPGAYDILLNYEGRIMEILNNGEEGTHVEDFYRQELAVRKNNPAYFNTALRSTANITCLKEKVNSSIEFDTEVLFSHTEMTAEDFSKRKITLVSSSYYVESARYLLASSGMMLQKLAKDRMYTVLQDKMYLNKKYRNPVTRFKLDREHQHMATRLFGSEAKKLCKQVYGK